MRWNDIYIGGVAAWLGDEVSVDEAVRTGRYDEQERIEDGYRNIRVAGPAEYPGDMAVRAARVALDRAATPAADIALVAHASVYFQGLDHWTPSAYIQANTIGGTASSLEIKQTSNGGLAALDLAASYLTVRQPPAGVLITTADRFSRPGFDRYRTDKGILLADGASAAVVSRTPGFAEVLSTALCGEPTLENLYRGDDPFSTRPGTGDVPLDIRARKKAFLATADFDQTVRLVAQRQQEVIEQAMTDAGVTFPEVAKVVFPNMGNTLMDWDFLKAVGVTEERTTWDWGRDIGHIGAGDQFAALEHLVGTRAVASGDVVLLAGSGIGFNFGCAVLRILGTPEWSPLGTDAG